MSEDARLSPQTRQAVQDLIARTASNIERVLAVARIGFHGASLARTLWVWEYLGFESNPRQMILLGILAAVNVAWALFILVGLRGKVLGWEVLGTSVTLDCCVTFCGLLINPLWPSPHWPGMVLLPDTGWLVVMIFGAGLRLRIPLVLLSGALATASFFALALVDQAHAGPSIADSLKDVVMWLLLILVTTLVSTIMVWLVRRVCRAGAERAVEAERARHGLDTVLEDHHDARTLLTSATLNAELLKRAADGEGRAEELAELARAVSDDLERINQLVGGIRERAYGELATLHEPEPVDLAAVARRVIAELEPRFPARLVIQDGLDGGRGWIAGGEASARRILTNLVVNACEGDGQRGAERVGIQLRPAGKDRVHIAIEDDGPGFTQAALRSPLDSRMTSKPDGSGLGLLLVETLLGPNAATLRRQNRPDGGASVSFELPARAGS